MIGQIYGNAMSLRKGMYILTEGDRLFLLDLYLQHKIKVSKPSDIILSTLVGTI